MRRSLLLFLAFALVVAFVIGCSSGGGDNVTLPTVEKSTQATHIGTYSWGSYQVVIDKNTHEVDITRLRGVDAIVNVLGFMEPPPLANMNIDFNTLVLDADNSYVGVDVILSHPIPDPVFTGFDVRGIVFGPDLMNADGLTPVMNPADFADAPFGYINGLLGAPDSYAHYDGIWGFKYFCDGLGLTDDEATFFSDPDNLALRGEFQPGSTNTRHYDLSWAGKETPLDFLVFNYAIYANYDFPLGEPPIDLEDFPISTNSQEAFCFKGTEVANTLYYADENHKGGMVSLDAEIWDWQGVFSNEIDMEGILPDSSEAGSTAYSGLYHFVDYDPGDALVTSAGLDLMITATSEVTFGEAWFLATLPLDNPLYDQPVYVVFPYTAAVGTEAPSLGLSIKDTGPLPNTLPITNEKNFCVTADNTFGKAGIYYFTGNVGFDVSYYPLDYSTPSTMKGSLNDPFFGNIGGLLFNVADLGSIEVPPMGAIVFCNRNTSPMIWGSYPADGPVWWSSATDFPNLTNGWLYFNMRFIDLEYVYDLAGNMWGLWTNNPAGVDAATFYLTPSYTTGFFSIEYYFTVDHSSSGIDGQVSEQNVKRIAIDNNVNSALLAAPDNMMWYYLETDPGNPDIEVIGNASTFAFPVPKYTIDEEELAGLPVDISTLNNWGKAGFEDSVFNYLCVLEDIGDGTWDVAVFEWDGSAMQLIARTDPINGTPHALDCDTVNQEIHVWATDGGVTNYWIFYFPS